ncbi:MAG TPA: hypothetical protein ENK96_10505 [Desulfobulbaceae bacterium]|nr:hypothetical protein [Desulfobulbaceae bacterium]
MKKYRLNNRSGSINIWFVTGLALAVAVVLFLTHDIIITNVLAWRICHSDPRPKTFIKKTVDYPESIYWEDNIYPGFDEKDRLLMIRNYLDGVHLKTMGLNAPDGSVFVFTANPGDWRVSNSMHKKSQNDWKEYFKQIESESRAIAAKGQHISRDDLPSFNYSVVFNPVPLSDFARRYLWSDEVVIRDNRTDEIIAFNRRLMHRWYLLNPDVALGNRFYYPHAMCGENQFYTAAHRVFITIHPKSGNFHGMDINYYLFRK